MELRTGHCIAASFLVTVQREGGIEQTMGGGTGFHPDQHRNALTSLDAVLIGQFGEF